MEISLLAYLLLNQQNLLKPEILKLKIILGLKTTQ